MAYKVRLDNFEGPFDLLVYLIENARMSIYDIRVSEITEQYIAYMEEMEQADVAVSSEFLVLAAELIDLKSKMLLPVIGKEKDPDNEDDPRTDLARRLLEYKRFRAVSKMLAEREELQESVMEKPQEDISGFTDDPVEEINVDEEQFVRAFRSFLERKEKIGEIRKRYEGAERQRTTEEERRRFIADLFIKNGGSRTFFDLVPDRKDRYDVALSFSSLMEMVREQELEAEQKVLFGTIDVSTGRKGFEKERKVTDVDSKDDQVGA